MATIHCRIRQYRESKRINETHLQQMRVLVLLNIRQKSVSDSVTLSTYVSERIEFFEYP